MRLNLRFLFVYKRTLMCTEEAVCLLRFSVYVLDLAVVAPHRLLFRREEHLCENLQHVSVPQIWLHICHLKFQNYNRRDIDLLAFFSNPPSPQSTQTYHAEIYTSVTVQAQLQNYHV